MTYEPKLFCYVVTASSSLLKTTLHVYINFFLLIPFHTVYIHTIHVSISPHRNPTSTRDPIIGVIDPNSGIMPCLGKFGGPIYPNLVFGGFNGKIGLLSCFLPKL